MNSVRWVGRGLFLKSPQRSPIHGFRPVSSVAPQAAPACETSLVNPSKSLPAIDSIDAKPKGQSRRRFFFCLWACWLWSQQASHFVLRPTYTTASPYRRTSWSPCATERNSPPTLPPHPKRTTGGRQVSRASDAHALQQRRLRSDRELLCSPRLHRRSAGCSWPLQIRRALASALRRPERRIRHRAMDRLPALVRWRHRHDGLVVWRCDATRASHR